MVLHMHIALEKKMNYDRCVYVIPPAVDKIKLTAEHVNRNGTEIGIWKHTRISKPSYTNTTLLPDKEHFQSKPR